MINEIKDISVDLIDAPQDQQRIDIDVEKLDELRESIRDHGLINPIQVREKNGRYELIAGSRRLKCHRLLEKATIKTIVLQVEEKEADILRAHENEFRHDPNPVESGIYILRLQDKHKLTVAEIAKQLNKSESYVRGRIELMTCPDYILEPLALGKLSVGAALHLAKIEPDEKRRQYVSWAVWRGITAAQASAWQQHAALGGIVQAPDELPAAAERQPDQKYQMTADCVICNNKDDINNMGMYYSHNECVNAISQKQTAAGVAAADEAVSAEEKNIAA